MTNLPSQETLPLWSGSNLAGSSNRGIMFEKEENLCAQQKNNRALCALDKSANRLPRKAGHCSIPTTNRTKTIKQPHKTATQPTTYFGHDQLLLYKTLQKIEWQWNEVPKNNAGVMYG